MFKYLLPLLLVLMAGCSSKKVDIDYDPEFSTTALSSFALVHKSTEGSNTLNDERIREAIVHQMELKGYKEAAVERADFHVSFQSKIEEDVPSNLSLGFGVGTFSSGLGTSIGTSHRAASDQGSLLINMLDPKTKKIFWRSSLTRDIDEFKTPQERSDYFDKSVSLMLEGFPKRADTGERE